MDPVPPALLLDDGELGRVCSVLRRVGVDFEHHTGYEGGEGVVRPSQLLVTSATRAKYVSQLETLDGKARDPIWVCAHHQDFLPMRERLRELGAHYLINSMLDAEAMRLFFLRALHRGVERRRNPRLQVLEEISYRLGAVSGKGRLDEISRRGCRLVTTDSAPDGTAATVYLPPKLARGENAVLGGSVAHCSAEAERSGGEGCSVIVVFDDLEPEAQACVDAILAGRNLGTRITPLEPPAEPAGAAPEEPRRPPAQPTPLRPSASEKRPANPPAPPKPEARDAGERREGPRHRYPSKLEFLDEDARNVVLGRDLSTTGIRLDAHPSLAVGAHVAIVLYGGAGDAPLKVAAEVVREHPGGFGLRFGPLTAEQRAWLQRAVAQLPKLQALTGDGASGGRIVSKVVGSGR
ncbi:MAG: PilZ domain-containing protein [Myxococcales bacterium]|nr:PilZ domain-containing protein [Myxococcales bacterium]